LSFLDGACLAGAKGVIARLHRINEPRSGGLMQLAHRRGKALCVDAAGLPQSRAPPAWM